MIVREHLTQLNEENDWLVGCLFVSRGCLLGKFSVRDRLNVSTLHTVYKNKTLERYSKVLIMISFQVHI